MKLSLTLVVTNTNPFLSSSNKAVLFHLVFSIRPMLDKVPIFIGVTSCLWGLLFFVIRAYFWQSPRQLGAPGPWPGERRIEASHLGKVRKLRPVWKFAQFAMFDRNRVLWICSVCPRSIIDGVGFFRAQNFCTKSVCPVLFALNISYCVSSESLGDPKPFWFGFITMSDFAPNCCFKKNRVQKKLYMGDWPYVLCAPFPFPTHLWVRFDSYVYILLQHHLTTSFKCPVKFVTSHVPIKNAGNHQPTFSSPPLNLFVPFPMYKMSHTTSVCYISVAFVSWIKLC